MAWTNHNRLESPQVRSLAILIVITLLAVLLVGISWTPKPLEGSSRRHQFCLGYHLYKHKVFAAAEYDDQALVPAAYREPGYPFFLAAMLAIYPGEVSDSIECVLAAEEDCRSILYLDYWCQASLLFVICILVGYVVFRHTNNLLLAFVPTSIMLIDNVKLIKYSMESGSPETLTKFLLLSSCMSLFFAARHIRPWAFFVAGLLMGALVLTKAIFGYLIWVVALAFGVYIWTLRGSSFSASVRVRCGRVTKTCGAMVLGFYIIVGPWMWRNYNTIGESIISHRAGDIFAIRAEYNQMTVREYFTAFAWWTPKSEGLVRSYLPVTWYQNLDRDNQEGYYRRGKRRRSEFAGQFGAPNWQKAFRREGLLRILAHPIRHLLATLPIAYRGIYFSYSSPIIVPCLLIFSWRLWRNRDWEKLLALLPAGYCFAMHSFFSHNLPRYHAPILPIATMATALVIYDYWKTGSPRLRKNLARLPPCLSRSRFLSIGTDTSDKKRADVFW